MTSNGHGGGARARARQAMRDQVAGIAMALILEKGYDETTVEDICRAAEISRSTFFRYFPTREDVLFGLTNDAGDQLLAALAARPSGEAPWVAMRRALDPRVEQITAGGERARRLARLIAHTPALAARHRDKNALWVDILRPEIARRLGADPAVASDPRPASVIAAALGCLDAALIAWTSSDQPEPLSEILDRAMESVG
jgi:AcrR family transcriptional regulator